MAKKPERKRVVAIGFNSESQGVIYFVASEAIVGIAEDYGTVKPLESRKNEYCLYIDQRYDFADVLAYLEGFND